MNADRGPGDPSLVHGGVLGVNEYEHDSPRDSHVIRIPAKRANVYTRKTPSTPADFTALNAAEAKRLRKGLRA